ncbi:MAG: carbon-nitrogen hydrolase family protein, partial [Bacteroidales bacterium]|nr:carbon-nitrogen hydrolase family protein [Bacteroidales bacterium]
MLSYLIDMTRNRILRSFIIILLNAVITTSSFAAKIAIIQYEVKELNEIGVDADRLETFIREAASQGAELVVTPETSFYRYEPWEQDGVTMLDLANHYEELKSKFSALAAELNISLVIGLREPSGDKEKPLYNTALFIGPDGVILGKQHKIFPSNSEMKWTKAGTVHSAFETAFGRVGMMICKTAKTNWWNSYEKEDNLDLFILIAGDKDAASFNRFSTICVKSNCYGLIANQICGPETEENARKGNSSWGYPDGTVEKLGGEERIFYTDLQLPIENAYGPQFGQIMVDPKNPSWLVYNRDSNRDGRPDPYFMCGPGDPEGFLYRGTRNLNGTRN